MNVFLVIARVSVIELKRCGTLPPAENVKPNRSIHAQYFHAMEKCVF